MKTLSVLILTKGSAIVEKWQRDKGYSQHDYNDMFMPIVVMDYVVNTWQKIKNFEKYCSVHAIQC